MFFVAYTLDHPGDHAGDDDSVTFVFNGGPGAVGSTSAPRDPSGSLDENGILAPPFVGGHESQPGSTPPTWFIDPAAWVSRPGAGKGAVWRSAGHPIGRKLHPPLDDTQRALAQPNSGAKVTGRHVPRDSRTCWRRGDQPMALCHLVGAEFSDDRQQARE
jgi:hypothetical protein